MKIVIGADHAGVELKDHLRGWLERRGEDVIDVGTHGTTSVDYPEFGHRVAHAVRSRQAERGILVCGTGIGMSMAANKHAGIRAAVCRDLFDTKLARAHNDANVLCIGARIVGEGLAEQICRVFLEGEFEGGRHARRVELIDVDPTA